MLEPPEQRAAQGIERSVDGLIATIRLFDIRLPKKMDVVASVQRISEKLGLPFEGTDEAVALCPNRLEAALGLAKPLGVSQHRHENGQIEIVLSGLSSQGVALLKAPHSKELVAAAGTGGRLIGACLFKEVVRGRRCEYEISTDDGSLRLLADSSTQSWSSPDGSLEDRCVES